MSMVTRCIWKTVADIKYYLESDMSGVNCHRDWPNSGHGCLEVVLGPSRNVDEPLISLANVVRIEMTRLLHALVGVGPLGVDTTVGLQVF